MSLIRFPAREGHPFAPARALRDEKTLHAVDELTDQLWGTLLGVVKIPWTLSLDRIPGVGSPP